MIRKKTEWVKRKKRKQERVIKKCERRKKSYSKRGQLKESGKREKR